ncbi:hypothetical protein LOK49_LG11G01460 [Camellia lanceoleosa]|uniref:Uncharacterized protein n=1 Tax=Camellia lanceoleosa TaxID=1840588 RepID=A0ACC0G1Y3_9ERIC|nr:hypothetical protein LOK49_LG11G01460 [Camellia lanceoleosa]
MDCRICVWNASDGGLVHSLTGHSGSERKGNWTELVDHWLRAYGYDHGIKGSNSSLAKWPKREGLFLLWVKQILFR